MNAQLIKELDKEIARTEKEVEGISALKEAQLKQFMSLFSMNTHAITNYKKLEQAIQTLRDTPLFGKEGEVPDFKWPTPRDLLKMPTSPPI